MYTYKLCAQVRRIRTSEQQKVYINSARFEYTRYSPTELTFLHKQKLFLRIQVTFYVFKSLKMH